MLPQTLVLDHVSPATRLLEKRRQMFEVQEALEAQKQEFNRKVGCFCYYCSSAPSLVLWRESANKEDNDVGELVACDVHVAICRKRFSRGERSS
jgi:hypothetical protein